MRKDVKGKSGYEIGAGNKLEAKTPVDSTYNDGDNKLVTMMFNYGKYLMISGSRPGDTGMKQTIRHGQENIQLILILK